LPFSFKLDLSTLPRAKQLLALSYPRTYGFLYGERGKEKKENKEKRSRSKTKEEEEEEVVVAAFAGLV